MTSLSYLEGSNTVIKSRAEKARMYREYVEANAAAGIDSNPVELDALRISMAGGDPFSASMIPAGDALKKLTETANEKAQNARMKTQTERWAMQDTERNYVQRIVDDNWDKSPEDIGKMFEGAFGADAPRVYDRYKPQLSNMLSESTGKQYAKIKSSPAAQYMYEPEDIDRLFPAEARNPAMRKVLDSVRQDNVRAKNKGQFKDTMEVLGATPDFVASNPEGQQAWFNTAAQGMGFDNADQLPANFKAMQGVAMTQAQAAQQAKVVQLAAKDPYFAAAAQSGDEDGIFAAATTLMVQSGMPAPKDKLDPNYLAVKKQLDMVSRTSAIMEYKKHEADIKGAAIEEADAIGKGQLNRMKAAAQAAFIGKEFSNGKSGKDEKLNESIEAAVSLINNDPSFFGSPENAQLAVNFVRQKFLADKGKFDPQAVWGEFMSTAPFETKAAWIDRRTNSQIQGNGLLKPGTNFRAKMDERKSQVTETVNAAFSALNKPTATQEEYTTVMNNKAVIVQRLRAQLSDISQSVNTANNDPAVRNNIVGFDFQSSLRDMEVLENSIQQIEKFNPVAPMVSSANGTPQAITPDNVELSLADSKRKLDEAQARLNGTWRERPVERDFWGNPVPYGPEQPSDFFGKNKDGVPLDFWGKPKYSNPPAAPNGTVTVVTPMSYESTIPAAANNPKAFTNVPRSRMDSYLDAIADVESSGDPFARAATSSAKGLFQFTKGTWDNLVSRYGEKFGITSRDIWNPGAQRVMAQILTMENGNQLMRQTGKEPTERDLYLAHFLGPSRAATVINQQGSSLLAANLFPDAAKANRGIFYKDGVPLTIEELYKRIGDKVTRNMRDTKPAPKKRQKVTELRYNTNGELES